MIIWKKFKRHIEDYGLWSAMKKGISYVLKPLYESKRYLIYGMNLDEWVPKETGNNYFTYKLLDIKDQSLILQIEAIDEWLRDSLQQKLENQRICIVALDSDRVAGYNLIGFNRINIPLVKITKDIKSNEAWSEQITVQKRYRKKGLASSLRIKAFNLLKSRGIKLFYGGTLTDNEASIALAKKMGFKNMVMVHYVKFLNNKRWNYDRFGSYDFL